MCDRLKGFKCIKISYSCDGAPCTMFMKEHSVRNQPDETPVGRTMYILNIPPWLPEEILKILFGAKTATYFDYKDAKLSGFKRAYVVFTSEKALTSALQLNSLPSVTSQSQPGLIGIMKLVHDYNNQITQQSILEQNCIKIIKDYDEKKLKEESSTNLKDDEGWTVVTRKGRNPGILRSEAMNEKLLKKTKKEKMLKNFYRHQIRQAKKDQLAELRKKAEEDKKKILALRQRRAFKPF